MGNTSKKQLKLDTIQDRDSIRAYLKQIIKGLEKGSLTLTHGDTELALHPSELMQLHLAAESQSGRQSLTIRVSWAQEPEKSESHPKLVIS